MAHGNVLSNRNYVEMPSADIFGEDVRRSVCVLGTLLLWRLGDAVKRSGGSSAGVAVRRLSRGMMLAQTTGIKAVPVPFSLTHSLDFGVWSRKRPTAVIKALHTTHSLGLTSSKQASPPCNEDGDTWRH